MVLTLAFAWLSSPAQAGLCDTASTGALSCYPAGYGRISAVVENFYESDVLQSYGCSPLVHAGSERVTTFTCHYTNTVRLELTGTECDLDILVLDDTCAPGTGCVGANTAIYDATRGLSGVYTLNFVCEVGRTYYIAVEAKSRPGGVTCPMYWRDVNGDGVQQTQEVGPGSAFRLYSYCQESCVDGYDNDRDGVIDCLDGDCSTTAQCCDLDGDGEYAASAACGGADCDDTDDRRYPGAFEVPADGVDQDCDGRESCWLDSDGDAWGRGSPVAVPDLDCTDPGEATRGGDCDDTRPTINPGRAEVVADGVDQDCDGVDDCYRDLDLDTWGTSDIIAGDDLNCSNLPGEAARSGDCDDSRDTINPGRAEIPGDGIDQNCDGVDACFLDLDRDGWGVGGPTPGPGLSCTGGWAGQGGDCDDGDGAVRPGGTEVCGGADEDCDGRVDEAGAVGERVYYRDADGDGVGGAAALSACVQPAGYVTTAGDCDDAVAAIKPGAVEICDGVDNDCDGAIDGADPGLSASLTVWIDGDGDGFGTTATTLVACVAPSGYATQPGDCDDRATQVYPRAPEVPGDRVDQDCDGVDHCWIDTDGDGYGEGAPGPGPSLTCASGFAAQAGDCAPTLPAIHPGADEVCDGVDNDCDLLIDGDDTLDALLSAWRDADRDGFGDGAVGVTVAACAPPSGYVQDDNDCDDTRADISPAAPETPGDAIDQDCDGVDHCYRDLDRDGWGVGTAAPGGGRVCAGEWASRAGDCDDTAPAARPDGLEVCGGSDEDCDGLVDEPGAVGETTWFLDGDGDLYGGLTTSFGCAPPSGYVAAGGDCDDALSGVNPGATERCDGIDNDCDALIDDADLVDAELTAWIDSDADGFGDPARPVALARCELPPGHARQPDDCDDRRGDVSPLGVEIPYDGVDQDCVGGDLVDIDRDSFPGGPTGTDCADTWPTVFPGATELADGIDQDCDGTVDDGTEWYDDDNDGFAEAGGDCDDARADVSPAGVEACNGVDDDCDGVIDEETECFDDDGDGFSEGQGDCHDGDATFFPGAPSRAGVDSDCDGGVGAVDLDSDGWTTTGGDCADLDPTIRPGIPEIVDGVDQDCDGLIDEGTERSDDDGDGFSEVQGDCHDGNPGLSPTAVEIPDNFRDDNCDGVVDEGGERVDDDKDGLSEVAGDCDDANDEVFPGAVERSDGIDNDCDGAIDEPDDDRDGDGYTVAAGDCNDDEGWMHPDLPEVCDGIDNDCNGGVDEGCTSREVVEEPDPVVDEGGCDAGGARPTWLALLFAPLLRRRRRS